MELTTTAASVSKPIEFLVSARSTWISESQLDLRQFNERKIAMKQIMQEWSSSTYEELITEQVYADVICPIVQYEFISQDHLLNEALLQIQTKLLQIRDNVAEYQVVVGHYMQICCLLIGEKLLLKYFFRSQNDASKLFLSIIVEILNDKFNHLPTGYLEAYLRFFGDTFLYWKKEHFYHMIQNGLCQLIKKYITKLRRGSKCYFLMGGIEPGWAVTVGVNNLVLVIRLFANKIYRKNKNDQILKRYELELRKAFLSKKYSHKLSYLMFTYCLMKNYTDSKGIIKLNDVTRSIYKARRMSFCGWIQCKTSDKNNKLYKCKGCKLILYCSRNHQKKHWKLIHSQQCLRSLYMFK